MKNTEDNDFDYKDGTFLTKIKDDTFKEPEKYDIDNNLEESPKPKPGQREIKRSDSEVIQYLMTSQDTSKYI